MSATRNVMWPEVSPLGAYTRRTTCGVHRRPVGISVWRRSRSKRAWGRRGPAVDPLRHRSVEIGAVRLEANQDLRATVGVGDREARLEGDAELGQADVQLGGRLGQVVRLPTQKLGERRPDVGEALLVAVQQLLEALLAGSGVAIDDETPLDQNGLGHHRGTGQQCRWARRMGGTARPSQMRQRCAKPT